MGLSDLICASEATEVRRTKELKRILSLPHRNPEFLGDAIAEVLTDELKTPDGEMVLRPLQALSIAECHDVDGGMVVLSVGEGKTLVSFLLPVMMQAKRPLLLVPGKLRDKTYREFEELKKHWQFHDDYKIVSYEQLSTTPNLLFDLKPDLIVADECQKLKSKKAGCTKRMHRYWQHATPQPKFIPMSGTLTTRSFMDWWHLQLWALPESLLVLPSNYKECETWAEALDAKVRVRRRLGALTDFGGSTIEEVRKSYGERLRCTPGVVASKSGSVGASIRIRETGRSVGVIDEAIKKMISHWELPNGDEFCEAVEMDRHALEMSQGFYYSWETPPPVAWAAARKEAFRFVRESLRYSRKYETPSQIFEAYLNEEEIARWLAVKDTFEPVTIATWITDEVALRAAEWLQKKEGLCWVNHTAMGERIEQISGVPFFSSQGRSKSGYSTIDTWNGPAIVSWNACREGFNLQKWSRNFVTCPHSSGAQWEQALGRTHRQGQLADEVEVDIMFHHNILRDKFKTALNDAEYIQGITGQAQKLVIADYEKR